MMTNQEEIRMRALELAIGRNRATAMMDSAPDVDEMLRTAARFAHFVAHGRSGPRAKEDEIGQQLLSSGLASCGEISLALQRGA